MNRSEEDILYEMVSDADTEGLVRSSQLLSKLREGERTENQYVLILSTDAKQFSILEADNDTNRENGIVSSARGDSLDDMGKLVNVPRVVAQSSEVELSISLSVASEQNITIPSGTGVILQNIYSGMGYEYVTKEEVTINAGSTSASVVAENLNPGYVTPIPPGAVTGLNGFSTLIVANEEYSTSGVDIDEDDVYREKILVWPSKNTRGTRPCIEAYLDAYEGIDRYKLIPLYDGVGTLKIVCDTLQSLTSTIAQDVYDNAMLLTDSVPVVVLPAEQELDDFTATVTLDWSRVTTSLSELTSVLVAQIRTYILGGEKRDGSSWKGIGMGVDFNPSLLWKFVLDQFPEVSNIYSSTLYEVVSVDAVKKLVPGEVTIEYDNVESV